MSRYFFDFFTANFSKNEARASAEAAIRDHWSKHKVRVNVSPPVEPFIGRDSVLKTLKENFLVGRPNICVLSGLCGVGKTQTVCEFIHRNDSILHHVLWIDARNVTVAADDFIEAAKSELKVPVTLQNGELRPYHDLVSNVYEALNESKATSLVVFDDCEGLENSNLGYDGIKRFLPLDMLQTTSCLFKVLIVSPNRDWGFEQPYLHLDLPPFDDAEAVEFVKVKSPTAFQDNGIKKSALIQNCGGLPVALKESLKLIPSSNPESTETGEPESVHGHIPVPESFLGLGDALGMTLYKIKSHETSGRVAMRIMRVLSFFPKNVVSKKVLQTVIRVTDSSFESGLRLLEKYLLLIVEDDHVQTLRPLQLVFRHQNLDEENITVVDLMKSLMTNVLCPDAPIDDQYQEEVDDLVLDICRRLASEYYKVSGQNVVTFVTFVASTFDKAGKLPQALECYRIVEHVIGTRPVSTEQAGVEFNLSIQYSIAVILERLGDKAEARELHQSVLESREDMLGPKHPHTLRSKGNIAIMLYEEGKPQESLSLHEEVLAARTDVLGPLHDDTLVAKTNVATMLRRMGEYPEAVAMLQEVVNARQASLGPDDPVTLDALQKFGLALYHEGNFQRALTVLEKVEIRRSKVLGSHHLDSLSTQSCVALVLKAQGKFPAALNRFRKVASKRAKVLGPQHLKTLQAESEVAATLRLLGGPENLAEALSLQRQVTVGMEEILGRSHPICLSALSNLANILLDLRELDEAERLYKEVEEERTKSLGPLHPETLMSSFHLAVLYFYQHRVIDSWELLSQIQASQLEVIGEDHPDSKRTRDFMDIVTNIGAQMSESIAMQKAGLTGTVDLTVNAIDVEDQIDLEAELEKQKQRLESLRTTLGQSNRNTLVIQFNVAKILKRQKRYKESLQVCKAVYEGMHKTLGPHHPEAMEVLHEQATLEKELNNFEAAIKLHQAVLDQRRRFLGEKNLGTCNSIIAVAKMHEQGENFQESLKLYEQVMPMLQQLFGDEHHVTEECKRAIERLSSRLKAIEEAAAEAREEEERRRRIVPPETLLKWSRNAKIGYRLRAEGKIRDACAMFKEILEEKYEILGEDGVDVLRSENTLAALLLEAGEIDAAHGLAKKVVRKRTEIFGPEHEETIGAKWNLGLLLAEHGEYKESIEVLKTVADFWRRLEGENDLRTLSVESNLASVMRRDNQLEGALQMAERIHKKREQVLGKTHPDTVASMNNVANLLRQTKKFDKALQIHTEVASRLIGLGEHHPDYLISKSNIANVWSDLGDYEKAVMMHKEVKDTRVHVLGELHPDTLTSSYNIAVTLKKLKRVQEAFEIFQKLVNQRTQVLGPSHIDTIASKKQLEILVHEQMDFGELQEDKDPFSSLQL